MTEEEAKNHLCPIAARNRRLNGEELGSNCVGADCMAWRWDEEGNLDREEHYNATAGGIPNSGPPKPIGYCGLAGKP